MLDIVGIRLYPSLVGWFLFLCASCSKSKISAIEKINLGPQQLWLRVLNTRDYKGPINSVDCTEVNVSVVRKDTVDILPSPQDYKVLVSALISTIYSDHALSGDSIVGTFSDKGCNSSTDFVTIKKDSNGANFYIKSAKNVTSGDKNAQNVIVLKAITSPDSKVEGNSLSVSIK